MGIFNPIVEVRKLSFRQVVCFCPFGGLQDVAERESKLWCFCTKSYYLPTLPQEDETVLI